MILCRTIPELKAAVSKFKRELTEGETIGFVPTMGYLHEGHASLLRRSTKENRFTVLSIFVNPMQFGPNEDLDKYPRNEERDLALAEASGVHAVFLPSVEEMYPNRPLTKVTVSQVTERLCGASRPGHFDGVGLVVGKLFHLVQPDRSYFGMKDAQQVAVVQQMVDDLNFPVEIVPCPIVREPDGLALSSRNVYLSAEQRQQAVVLSQSLELAKKWLDEGKLTPNELLQRVQNHITSVPQAEIDYVELLTYPRLEQVPANDPISGSSPLILALAVKFGTTRLIDNTLLTFGG
ncbi:pantoate--beta-alanine ligase [Paenibacillus protaetiae]|uniref:Pantothenate synthetase n=1 Tax=Paenibacillus protaetiae TaxID=2509456 RepID=A0A4P6ESM4_9BACL|nr:pantoate--beta-alanine ligase [Paenibacillus protaetiae]QAY66130.1 pantoate--beta-alanine ligase [Paenibacillus protaetiae]